MNKDLLKGINIGIGFILVISILGIVSAVGFHVAEEIMPGTFVGDYLFDGSLIVGKNNFDSILAGEGSFQKDSNLEGHGFIATPWIYARAIEGDQRGVNATLITLGGENNFTNSDQIGLITNGKLRVIINSVGNVGIGTKNPLVNLHVSSGNDGDSILRIESDTNNDNTNEDNNPRIELRQDAGATGVNIGFYNGSLNAGNNFRIGTRYGSVNYWDTFVIDASNGNIGIGTTTPKAKLDVNGDVKIGGSITVSNKYTMYMTTGNLIYYTNPSGVQTSFDLDTCAADSWCCNAGNNICYYKYSSGIDAILQFSLVGSNSISCTLLHNEDDTPRKVYYSTDGGNNCYGGDWCFRLRQEGAPSFPITMSATYDILCF